MRVLSYSHNPWFQRNNSDFKYMKSIASISDFSPLSLRPLDHSGIDLIENGVMLMRSIINRLGLELYPEMKMGGLEYHLLKHERKQEPWDVFYTNYRIPTDTGLGPVVRFDYIHETDEQDAPERYRRDVNAKLAYSSHCDALQVSTEAQKNAFVRIGVPDNKIHVVPFFLPNVVGIDSEAVTAKHQKNGALKIVFVGRQAKLKGLEALLAALEEPAMAGVPHDLTIVSKMLGGQVALPNSNKVAYHESLPHDDVLHLLREAHVLCVPSHRETFGMVYVEAMANGVVPVLAAGPQQREISGHGEWGFPTGPDPKKIAVALKTLYSDNAKRLDMSLRAHKAFRERYCASVVSTKYHNMFQSVLAGR